MKSGEGTNNDTYGKSFFALQDELSSKSAKVIVPLLWELLRPRSVVDVGSGTARWLAAFRAIGVADVLAIDGDYVDRKSLAIPQELFTARDLTRPVNIDRRFDLAISLEVAEHLPAEAAEVFVQSLVKLAPVVAFSAAIPNQGGDNHVNEQWPEYWAGLFGRHGYHVVDYIRSKVWNDPQVEWYYKQNLLIFFFNNWKAELPNVNETLLNGNQPLPLSVVHPGQLLAAVERGESLNRVIHRLPSMIRAALANRFRKG